MIDKDKIAELRRLEAEATKGHWELDAVFILDGKKERAGVYTSDENPSEDDLICELRYADAALIVAMRNALPELLKALEALQQIDGAACDALEDGGYREALIEIRYAARKALPPHGGGDAG